MNSSIKTLIIEVLLEALWGKQFQLVVRGGKFNYGKYTAIASKNTIPDERPYRITWFHSGEVPAGHIDLEWEEMNHILEIKKFPDDIVQRISLKWGIPIQSYTILPMLYECKNTPIITEGINLTVAGHKYDDQYEDIFELALWLAKKVQGPLMSKMSEEEKKIIKHDIITPDGGNGNIINVYIGLFPEKWRAKLLGGIEYFLKKDEVKTGPWAVNQSKVYSHNDQPVQTVRIPITKLNPKKDAAPSVSMSYSSLKTIMNLLKLDPNYFDDYMSSVPVDDLLHKIEVFKNSDDEESVYDDKLQYFINKLNDMAQWAKKHGNTHINGA